VRKNGTSGSGVSGEDQLEDSVGQYRGDSSSVDVGRQVELSLDVVASEPSLVDVPVELSLWWLRDDVELVSGELDVDVVAGMAGKVQFDDVVVADLVDIAMRSRHMESM